MQEQAAPGAWRLLGGRPSLDFVNTLSGRDSASPRESLTDYGRLLAWAEQAGQIDAGTAAALRRRAAAAPRSAEAALAQGIELRQAIHDCCMAAIEGRAPAEPALDALGRHVAEAHGRRRLAAADGRLGWRWADGAAPLDRPLWPVALDAEELLTGDLVGRVRQCAGADCGWLFLDLSKNRSRRWCSMADCGNLAKVQRFRRKGGAR